MLLAKVILMLLVFKKTAASEIYTGCSSRGRVKGKAVQWWWRLLAHTAEVAPTEAGGVGQLRRPEGLRFQFPRRFRRRWRLAEERLRRWGREAGLQQLEFALEGGEGKPTHRRQR